MTVTTPPRAPETGRDRDLEQRVADLEALMKEARRRARRRYQRNLVGVVAAVLGALWLYSHLGTGRAGSGPAMAPGTPHLGASRPKAALPEELSFSANGSVVLVRRDLRRLPFLAGIFQPRGERQRHLYGAIDWSPDGSKLLALRWGYGVRALEVTDESGKVVSTVDPHAFDGRWSPDGSRIAFVHDEPGLGHVLFVASSDGRVLARIAAHVQTFGRAFSWSPDATKLAYASQGAPYAAQGAHGLVIADATGRRAPRPLPIATGAGSPRQFLTNVQWSPDGSLIAFSSRDDTGPHLDVVHPDGSSLRRVADGFGFEFDWSPNGKRLAIVGPGADVSVVNADGTDLHRIARCRCDLSGRFNPSANPSVSWSLDGTRIAYVSGRGNTVSTIRPDGTGATVVATQAVGGVPGYLYPSSLLWRPTRAH